jgi:hypothetical protein
MGKLNPYGVACGAFPAYRMPKKTFQIMTHLTLNKNKYFY